MFILLPKLGKALNITNLCELCKHDQEIAPDPEHMNGTAVPSPTFVPGLVFHFISGDKQFIAFDSGEERDRTFASLCGAIGDKEKDVFGGGNKIVVPSLGFRQ